MIVVVMHLSSTHEPDLTTNPLITYHSLNDLSSQSPQSQPQRLIRSKFRAFHGPNDRVTLSEGLCADFKLSKTHASIVLAGKFARRGVGHTQHGRRMPRELQIYKDAGMLFPMGPVVRYAFSLP
jgi:hypothetical protein